MKNYYHKNKIKIRKKENENRKNNPEKYKQLSKKYRDKNKDKIKERKKKYREENKEKVNFLKKQSYERCKNNVTPEKKQKRNEWRRNYKKNKINNDNIFRLRERVSTAINLALKRFNLNKGGKSITKILPYTIEELKNHLESKFETWMNWDNWGIYKKDTWDDNDELTWTWQIDHIIPQNKLFYSSIDDDNFKLCWSLNNLRPYSAKQNNLDKDRKNEKIIT
ncbi:MAG: hypothetical protein LC122_13195 [Chitinophagales bacterium]|nr:hypothetical protein [Chitinophagales bacterium]